MRKGVVSKSFYYIVFLRRELELKLELKTLFMRESEEGDDKSFYLKIMISSLMSFMCVCFSVLSAACD